MITNSEREAMNSIFKKSLEEFFARKTDVDIQNMILAPYREARLDMEKF